MLSTSTKIKRYVAANEVPVQEKCPDIRIHWTTKTDGYCYYRPLTGEITHDRMGRYSNECDTIRSTTSYNYYGIYANIINKDLIEIAKVIMNGKRSKPGIKRNWTYEDRLFMDSEGNPYDIYGNRIWEEYQGRYYNKKLLSFIHDLNNFRINSKKASEEFGKFLGAKESINYAWQWEQEFKARFGAGRKNSAGKAYLEIELPKREYTEDIIEFSIVNGNGVFRLFQKPYNYYGDTKQETSREVSRVFITPEGKVSIFRTGWSGSGSLYATWDINSCAYINGHGQFVFLNDIAEIPKLKWIWDVVSVCNDDKGKLIGIIDTLRHPMIEKLYKAGYRNIASKMFRSQANEVFKSIFGLDKVNEKHNLYKALKISKSALKLIDEYMGNGNYNDIRCVLYSLRQLIDVQSCDENKFKTYFDVVTKAVSMGRLNTSFDPNSYAYYRWGRQREELTDTAKENIYRMIRLEQKDKGSINAFIDLIRVYRQLTSKPEINFGAFRNKEEIIRVHDNLTALLNIQMEDERRYRMAKDEERSKMLQEKFEKLQKKRIEKFECVGSNYSVVVPKTLEEITSEGVALNHCVGSYLDRHGKGETNILFLRHNEYSNIPFYTIEVNENDRIVQIHGRNNKWLGNDPEAISFVNQWLTERNLRCEKKILLDTATGYAASGNLVSETYMLEREVA